MRIFLLLLMLCGFQVFAERLPSVTDLTGTLTTEEQSALNQQLQTLEQQNHFQVAVLVTPTTGGKNIKLAASQRYGVYHWKPVGEKRYGEGILILVVWPEGLASMKIGHGLEQMLPPEQAAQIVRYHMQPEFEKNNLFAGLTGGIESIAQFTHIKANLSPLDAAMPCLDSADDRCHHCPLAIYQPSRTWHMDDINDYTYGLVFLLSGRCHHSAGVGRLF